MKKIKYCAYPAGVILAFFLLIEALIFAFAPVDTSAATHTEKFRATAYCGCRKCNGRWTGQPTASGTDYKAGRTVAVYRKQIPLGTHIFIDGSEYVAEDTGSGINRNCVDIYFDSHSEALNFGRKYVTVTWED